MFALSLIFPFQPSIDDQSINLQNITVQVYDIQLFQTTEW